MRKILLILLVSVGFLSASINEYKSDVYFANGIDTSNMKAKDAIDDINKTFKSIYPKQYSSIANWDVSYNHTHGIGIDLYESMLQKIYEDPVGKSLTPVIWNFSEIFGFLDYSFKSLVSKIAKKTPKEAVKKYAGILAKKLAKKSVATYSKYGKKFTQAQIEMMFNAVFDDLIDKGISSYIDKTEEEIAQQESDDMIKHRDAYTNSIKNGHGVIVISHSQGNLFVNHAYKNLASSVPSQAWMQKYFHILGIASPANHVATNGGHMTFDNDMIQLVPDSLTTNVTNPKRYYFENGVGEKIETLFSVKAHAFLSSYMATEITRNGILGFIDDSIDVHKQTPSQWKTDQEFKKDTKDYRITLKHISDENDMDKLLKDIKVYPFNPKKGKLYQAQDPNGSPHYVKASFGGEKIQDSWSGQDEDNEFYKLEGTSPIEYITGKKKDCKNISMIPGGLFNAQLRWHEEDVDMSLSSSLMSQSESGCGIAAAGSGDKTLYSVYPGTYSVNVLASGYEKLDHNISDLITLNVNAVGNSKKSSTLVTKAYEYAHLGKDGHLADIVITRPDPTKPPVIETIPSIPKVHHITYGSYPYSSGGSSSHSHYSYYGGHYENTSTESYRPELCNESCGCLPCEYDILMYLNQARLGPISGAKVLLYKATQEDDVNRDILYEGSTSVSSEIDKAGVISLPIPYPEQKILSDDEKSLMDKIAGYDGDFILEVSGGFDIDNDDDYNVDSSFTKVNGKLHLIVDKESLLNNDYKVNILTEVAYQLSRDILGKSYDKKRIKERLDDISSRVFIEKLYPSSNDPISRDDLFYWIPSAHKKWLVKSYAEYLKPIVDKVYRGDDIYDDAYKFVYEDIKKLESNVKISPEPILSSTWINVSEDIQSPSKIGKISIKSEGNSSIISYTIHGSGSELFEIKSSGEIYLKDGKKLDFEKNKTSKLTVVAKNSDGISRPVTLYIIVSNVLDAPESTSFSGGVFSEDAKSGDIVGNIFFNEGTSPINKILIKGEDKESFDVELNGTITLSSTANFDYESKNYAKITLQAFNSDGGSDVVEVIFIITDAIDVPIVKSFDAHISETAKELAIVGKVEILSNDPIIDIRLSGYGSEDFKIDNSGEIRVNDGVTLDYERRSNYVLKVVASNLQGDSKEGTVVIRIDNELDIPVLENRTYHILEYSPIDNEVGKVGIKTEGLSSISGFTLSGYGNENFTIDDSGMIRVANDMLSYFDNQYFNLNVKATNTQGDSNRAIVVVYIDTNRPILGSLNTYVYENSLSHTYLGKVPLDSSPTNIISATLDGEGSENFTINNKLEVRVSDIANIDYEYRKNYNLTITATNSAGESDKQNVYIRVIDKDDTIRISGFSTTIYEDAKGGDTIGFIKVITTGGFTINHYILSGDGSENFEADDSGIVRVSNGAIFDRINHPRYHLQLIAEDANGVKSDKVYLDIRVIKSINTPVAKSQNFTIDEDIPKSIELIATDKDGDPLTYIITTPPINGAYKGGIYTPNLNYYGFDKIVYKANDGKFNSDLATISITINSVNDKPIVKDQNITLDEDHTKYIRLIGSDVDGDRLTYIIVTPPTHGVYKDGVYTPNANYFGSDKIIYKANDGKIDSNLATISITINSVNDVPVAKSQSITLDEDTSKAIKLSATDIEGDALTYKIVSSPVHGVYKDGVYTPEANYNGPDSFTFIANDGKDDSKYENISIVVKPINDKPVAKYQTITLDENKNKAITLKGRDVDGDSLIYTIVTPPTHGTYIDGLYTPDVNYFGLDQIIYKANDGQVDSDLTKIEIKVKYINSNGTYNTDDIHFKVPKYHFIDYSIYKIDVNRSDIQKIWFDDEYYFNNESKSKPPFRAYKDGNIYILDSKIDVGDYQLNLNIEYASGVTTKQKLYIENNYSYNSKNDIDIFLNDFNTKIPERSSFYTTIGSLDLNITNIDKIWFEDTYYFDDQNMSEPPFSISFDGNMYPHGNIKKGAYELKLFIGYETGLLAMGKVLIESDHYMLKKKWDLIIEADQETNIDIGSIETNPIVFSEHIKYSINVPIGGSFLLDTLKFYNNINENKIYAYVDKHVEKYANNSYNIWLDTYNSDNDLLMLDIDFTIKSSLIIDSFYTKINNFNTFDMDPIGELKINLEDKDIGYIKLSGDGHDDFFVDAGNIFVQNTIDYNRQSIYNLTATIFTMNGYEYSNSVVIEVSKN